MKSVPVCFLVALSAAAQEPSDSVKWAGADKVEINSTVVARTGCYSAGQPTNGHPDGTTPVENAVLITFPLEHNGSQMCAQVMTPVKYSITADAPAGAQAIVIYTVDKFAKKTTVRALALPAKARSRIQRKTN